LRIRAPEPDGHVGHDGQLGRRYLRNNQDHMNYAEYRKQGLPVTSSLVESLIKEINYRVKGTEKFWDNPEGAEAILQLRAAVQRRQPLANIHHGPPRQRDPLPPRDGV
jgi:hypothetical protein